MTNNHIKGRIMNKHSFNRRDYMKVSHNLYKISLPTPFGIGNVHTYLLIENKITLFDAGVNTEEAWRSFNEQLSSLALKVEDIDQIILTHHHPDHTGLVSYFKEDIPIAAHPNLQLWLTRDVEYFSRYEETFRQLLVHWGVPSTLLEEISSLKGALQFSGTGQVTIPLHHLDRVPGHEDWIVLYTPGHAGTHLSFIHEQDRIFIGGDLLLEKVSSNPLLEGPYKALDNRAQPMIDYRNSLQLLRELDVHKVLPGHGPIITDVNVLIADRLKSFQKRTIFVKMLLQKEKLTAFELSKKIYPKQTKEQLLLTMSQTIGYIDLLVDAQEIISYEEDGVFQYNVL